MLEELRHRCTTLEVVNVTEQLFSFPEPTPLTRLHVQDSLRINAERWLLAHNYHRQRQNLHYQALWEPGIVCGLGVKTIAAPADVPSQFRDQRWIEIQPGIAIDLEGNPIVIGPEEDRTYRIAAPAPLAGTRLLHVVVRYVDPNNLELDANSDHVIERFRFDQRIGQLQANDIEICRIALSPGEIILGIPANPLNPGPNELDLRHRRCAQLRPHRYIRVGTLTLLEDQQHQQWQGLVESLPLLHPTFQGNITTAPIELTSLENLLSYDLIYLSSQTLQKWQTEVRTREWEFLRRYLRASGFLYIEVPEINASVKNLLHQLGPVDLQFLAADHPMKQQPFYFGQLPNTEQGSVKLAYSDGILVANTMLTAAWRDDRLPRHAIRAAQELGINVLYFAWQRRYFHQLLS